MPIKQAIRHPIRFLSWVFEEGKGTRGVELLNVLCLFGFTMPLLLNFQEIMYLATYTKFYILDSILWWLGMGVLGVLQLVAMVKKSWTSNLFSGWVLLLSSTLWGVICTLFVAALPPLTPAPLIYGSISLITGMAGYYTIRKNKISKGLNNKEQ